jgi:hypothetical protein
MFIKSKTNTVIGKRESSKCLVDFETCLVDFTYGYMLLSSNESYLYFF